MMTKNPYAVKAMEKDSPILQQKKLSYQKTGFLDIKVKKSF
jgi:hypothetical protein